MAPHQQWSSQKMVGVEESFRKFMKDWSVKVPALKDLLDRPLDLACVELVERAVRTAGVVEANWSSLWGKAWRSLKRYGSSPESVLDLLCFLKESSDEKMQQMDLDDVTVEQVAAARSALRGAIGKVEPTVKKGEDRRNWHQVAPWLLYLSLGSWCLGSEDLPMLQAVEARASTLMTGLEQEAQKENDRCLQEANLKTKQNELHIQVQQLTQECERLKQEESQRQAVTSQLRQLQLECGHLRKRQEESESERLKEEESKRQEHALQMQQIQSECDKFRMKQDELQMQVQELTHECERLKQEESQRQAVTSQLQQLQLENEKLKKKEFKFNSLVATAESLKSKVEQFCNECEKCDAEDVSQPDSSWEVCTPMTEASDISGRCFMTDAVFKAPRGVFVSGQDLSKGSKILAADGSIMEVADFPEVSEKRGKVVLQTEKAKLEVTALHRVVNVTHEGEKRQVPAYKLRVGDLVMVDNQPESLTHVYSDPATFEVLKIGFSPDKPVEAFSVPPTMQSYGHKMVKRHRGGRRACRGRKDDHLSIPDTEGYLTD